MPEVTGGFVAYRSHELGVQEETEDSLRAIYQASLSLLYKCLFILYAEARGLLPIANSGYREQSLTALAQWAAEHLERDLPLSDATHAATRYDALLALFHRIDRGDPSLGIPRYNGGLFNPASPENHFLEQHKLSDRAVARAVDTLVRDAGQPVDYAYLDVRNLGAIYEGLLENRLVVDRPQGSPETLKVSLVNDKGERKATGSYYTPDYIVEYIVQHTLDPILDERDGTFRAAMERCAGLRRQLRRVSDKTAIGLLREQLDGAERDAREAFLGLKVLDPAMGSGHFLVNAVDHLTDAIILRMQTYHDEHPGVLWEWNPIQQLVERVREDILAEMERQGIRVDPERLNDTAILTRLVMKRCIYGVDLNPMAVELAKVSLWLHSFTIGAPLSFLDHHLRWGNSLVGTDVRTVEQALRASEQTQRVSKEARKLAEGRGEAAREVATVFQADLFGGPFAGLLDLTGLMTEVVERADSTLADVRHSAEDFDRFQKELTPYKQMLDLWVSQYFGNDAAKEFLTVHGADVLPALRGEKQVIEQYQEAIQQGRDLWRARRFFHWDLEFPEVFVDLRRRDWAQNPGFDAVVGNPPYDVLSEKERKEDLSYFMTFIDSDEGLRPAQGRKVDLFRLFVAKAISLVRPKGIAGLIVPMSLLADQQTATLRRHLLARHSFLGIDAFPQKDDASQRVFPEAKLPTCIVIIQNFPQERRPFPVITHPGRLLDGLSGGYLCQEPDLRTLDEEGLAIPLLPSMAALNLAKKLYSGDKRLCLIGDLTQTYQGEINETTMAHLLSTDPTVGPKVLRGGNVQRYEFQPEAKQGVDKYLDVQAYERQAGGEKVMHTRSPRIGYQRNAALDNWRRLIFASLPSPSYCFDSISYFLVEHETGAYALLALLNSQLLEWRFRLTSTNNHVSTREVAGLPAVRFTFTTPPDERARLVGTGITEATEWVERAERAASVSSSSFSAFSGSALGRWLDARLAAEPEQADAAHDLLAHLAEAMITLNKDKQAEMHGFLAWLAREIGAPLDDLTHKTRLQHYLGDYQKGEAHLTLDELLDILRANRRRLQVDPSARAFQERLEQEYAASLGKLLPLKARLAATDRLIDLIVYRLYGLTEEEVATVEGSRE